MYNIYIYMCISKERFFIEHTQLFLVRDPKFQSFYLLPMIDKWLLDVSVKLVISNRGFYTENVSLFLDFH